MHISRLLPAHRGGPGAPAQLRGQLGAARLCQERGLCMAIGDDGSCPVRATSLSVHSRGKGRWQRKPWWPQVPAWPRLIWLKWAPRAMQGVGRKQRAECWCLHPPCYVLRGAEVGCGTHPASGTTELCSDSSDRACAEHHATGRGNLHPDSSAPSSTSAWLQGVLLLAHQRWSCHSYTHTHIYIYLSVITLFS